MTPIAPAESEPLYCAPAVRVAGRVCKIAGGTVKLLDPVVATQMNFALE